MKLTIDRNAMLKALRLAAGIAPERSPKPVLQNVLLIAGRDGSELVASDLQTGIRVHLPATTKQPGRVLLPPVRTLEWLAAAPADCVELSINKVRENSTCSVTGGNGWWQFPTQPPQDFPSVPEFDGADYASVDSRRFRSCLERMAPLIGDGGAYALDAIRMATEGQSLHVAATDGRHLGCQAMPAEVAPGRAIDNGLLPRESAKAVARAIAYDQAMTEDQLAVRIGLRDNSLLFAGRAVMLACRMAQGRYPRVAEAFPSGSPLAEVDVPARQLLACIRQALATSDRSDGSMLVRSHGARLSFMADADAAGRKGGLFAKAEVEMVLGEEPAAEIRVRLDGRLMVSFLAKLPPEGDLTLRYYGSDRAVGLHSEDGFNYIIMPLCEKREKEAA